MKKKFYPKHSLILFFYLILGNNISISQNTSPNKFLEWTTWTLIQAVPSPTFFQDKNESNSRLQFGFRWNITPVNYSFNANPLVSAVQFFKVNPVRRFGGSIELFIQPEWATSGFQYSDLQRFNHSAGTRVFIPAVESGEYLSFSLGGKYNIRKNKEEESNNYYSAEAGIYTLFGIAGLLFDYNFFSQSRYNISLNLKYY
ncbi:MAG: hypothetical protein M3R36_02940 [Bacteroidota bacterium]|nr:hypothetical protein [Bacteroidota bacterium]